MQGPNVLANVSVITRIDMQKRVEGLARKWWTPPFTGGAWGGRLLVLAVACSRCR